MGAEPCKTYTIDDAPPQTVFLHRDALVWWDGAATLRYIEAHDYIREPYGPWCRVEELGKHHMVAVTDEDCDEDWVDPRGWEVM